MIPNWVGDIVMATPALRALRESFPQARLIGLMRPHLMDVLAGTNWLDEVVPYSRKSRRPERTSRPVLRYLRRLQLDKFVLLTNSFSTAWLAWRSGARQRIGFARQARGALLTHRLQAPKLAGRLVPRSAVDHYLELAQAAGCGEITRQLQLATTAQDERAADRVWEKLRLNAARRVVTLNTGAAYGPSKAWPDDYFAVLGRRICVELDAHVLVLCGPAERDAARRIEHLANHPRLVSLAGEQPGLGLSKACVQRSQLMVSTDSGPRHFAAAFGVPLVTLFGSTDPRWSENYHWQAADLLQPLACSPCGRRTCPLGHHRCMRDLTPDRVFAAVQRMLDSAARQPPRSRSARQSTRTELTT